MTHKSFTRLALLAVMLLVLALTAFPAEPVQAAADSPTTPYARFTIENNSNAYFIIVLSGTKDYVFEVPAKTKKSFAPVRGIYSYVMGACNFSATGTIDLTKGQTIHVPVCGGSAKALRTKNHHIDASEIIRPIRIRIWNKTGEANTLLLTNVDTRKSYYLELGFNEKTELILLKGDYRFSYMACGNHQFGIYEAKARNRLEMTCKKD